MADKFRYVCPSHRSEGTGTNHVKIRRDEIEGWVVAAVRHHLTSPAEIETALVFMEQAMVDEVDTTEADRALVRKKIKAIDKSTANIVDTIAEGHKSPALLAKLTKLETDEVA